MQTALQWGMRMGQRRRREGKEMQWSALSRTRLLCWWWCLLCRWWWCDTEVKWERLREGDWWMCRWWWWWRSELGASERAIRLASGCPSRLYINWRFLIWLPRVCRPLLSLSLSLCVVCRLSVTLYTLPRLLLMLAKLSVQTPCWNGLYNTEKLQKLSSQECSLSCFATCYQYAFLSISLSISLRAVVQLRGDSRALLKPPPLLRKVSDTIPIQATVCLSDSFPYVVMLLLLKRPLSDDDHRSSIFERQPPLIEHVLMLLPTHAPAIDRTFSAPFSTFFLL